MWKQVLKSIKILRTGISKNKIRKSYFQNHRKFLRLENFEIEENFGNRNFYIKEHFESFEILRSKKSENWSFEIMKNFEE